MMHGMCMRMSYNDQNCGRIYVQTVQRWRLRSVIILVAYALEYIPKNQLVVVFDCPYVRTYELPGITHVTPFRKYGKNRLGLVLTDLESSVE